jgi:CDP-2,3-bis-(O-geranylgeranyl)-sn-glycerol synthase
MPAGVPFPARPWPGIAADKPPRIGAPVVLASIVGALWAMLPAYVPNNAAVVLGGGPPVDGGRRLGGARLLGDGKTWRGTVGGTATGVALALVLDAVRPSIGAAVGGAPPPIPPSVAVGLAGGAMLGDVVASFLKRRLGRARGASVPGLDQLDFVVGAIGTTALIAPAWVARVFTPAATIAVVVLTPALHLGTNLVAHRLGLKGEPW